MEYNEKDIVKILEQNQISYKSTCNHVFFNSVCALEELKSKSITWCKDIAKYDVENICFENTIVFTDINNYDENLKNMIFIPNLKRNFFKVVNILFSDNDPDLKSPKIEHSATVLTEQVGQNLYVGHNSFIDKNVILGSNVTIMNNVVIQGNVNIGNDVFIESGTVIGACGFGYYKDEYGNSQKVPHFGSVIIGNHVTIGAGNCISRGSLNNTIINDYVKTDNLCHIAHSVSLDKGVMLAACAELSGSVKIGEDTWIAPGVSIINGAKIGKNVYTGIGTNIVKNVPDGSLIYGNPGKVKESK